MNRPKRGKGEGEVLTRRSNERYSVDEYAYIFISRVMGLKVHEIARVLERQSDAVRRAFDRICVNGVDYSNKRLYRVGPCVKQMPGRFSGAAKQYIKSQWVLVAVRPSIEELCRRLNIKRSDLVDYIQKNEKYWKPLPKDTLF
jgi:hypothetical protein